MVRQDLGVGIYQWDPNRVNDDDDDHHHHHGSINYHSFKSSAANV
jgi:hypothetical protein